MVIPHKHNKKPWGKIFTAVSLSSMMLFSNTAVAASTLQKLGSSGEEVTKIQEQLKTLGYYDYHKITGYYGTITRDAVIKFQAAKGLTKDGIVGSQTKSILFGSTISSNTSTTKSTGGNPLLKQGDRGEAVKELQRLLKEKGYYSSSIDGIFGAGTKNSVINYQRAAKLIADGIVGAGTWSNLTKGSGNTGTTSDTSPNRGTEGRPLLKQGDSGEAVKELQRLLKEKGYYYSSIDGSFGPGTKTAVINFQKATKLTADGIVGASTWSNLAEVTGSTGPLKNGSKGTGVYELQTWLKNLGFYSGKIDGEFGPGTDKALKSFQKANGLLADGIAGAKTMDKLRAYVSDSSRGDKNDGKTPVDSEPPAPVSGANELLHWDYVSNIWAKNFGQAIITDIVTGKSFRVVRTGGSNHADVETASAHDTAVMKEIFGGIFSWDRRAVAVQVGGRRIAASMAGMPHAGRDDKPYHAMVSGRSGGYGYGMNYDGIKSNNMNGHFDVHFHGSRTHETNRADQRHQEMVQAAARASN